MVFGIVQTISLPTGTANESADSLRVVMSILFGPDHKSETLEISKSGAVVLVKRCPLPAGNTTSSAGDMKTFHKCMALTLTTVPNLIKIILPALSGQCVRGIANVKSKLKKIKNLAKTIPGKKFTSPQNKKKPDHLR